MPRTKLCSKRMAERPMANVVQQDRDGRTARFLIADRVPLVAQRIDGFAHQVHGPQCVVEARVQGPGIHQVRQAPTA